MTAYMDAAQALLTCLENALNARANPPAAVMLRAGEQVTPLLGTSRDECCEGLGWVRIAEILPRTDFPGQKPCFGVGRRLTLEMGVVRCAPTSDVSTIPTEEQWTNVSLQLDSDIDAMEAALCCAFEMLDEIGGSATASPELGSAGYRPTGVDGNCIGGIMTVEMEIDCGCQA
jgi:hypothetical protein